MGRTVYPAAHSTLISIEITCKMARAQITLASCYITGSIKYANKKMLYNSSLEILKMYTPIIFDCFQFNSLKWIEIGDNKINIVEQCFVFSICTVQIRILHYKIQVAFKNVNMRFKKIRFSYFSCEIFIHIISSHHSLARFRRILYGIITLNLPRQTHLGLPHRPAFA